MSSTQSENGSAPPEEQGRVVRQIRRLTIARLAFLPLGGAMGVGAAVSLLLVIPRLLTGDFHSLTAAATMLIWAALFGGAAAIGVPRIDRKILELARGATGRSACVAMLNLMNGLPLTVHRREIEQEMARQLDELDADAWQENAKELREQVDAALESSRQPSWLHPADGPWIPALLRAITRCGRTEHLRSVEALARRAASHRLPVAITDSAGVAAESLRLRRQHEKEVATLLRPSTAVVPQLLRPAGDQRTSDSERLLRPGDTNTRGQSTIESQAADAADEAHLHSG